MKIHLHPKSSGETEAYPSMQNIDYDNAVVEAEVITKPNKPACALILGSEMIRIGGCEKSFKPEFKYTYGDFDTVEGE